MHYASVFYCILFKFSDICIFSSYVASPRPSSIYKMVYCPCSCRHTENFDILQETTIYQTLLCPKHFQIAFKQSKVLQGPPEQARIYISKRSFNIMKCNPHCILYIIFLIACESCIKKQTKFVSVERTKCMGGSERREDFPSVVMVR